MADYYFWTDGMSVGYQGVPVVEKLKFGIRRGEILTLIGPNGAGKSTILKSLAGQLALVAGTVYISGNRLDEIPGETLAKEMSVMFTERLHAEMMTCEEVVCAGRYPYTGKFGILSRDDYRAVEEAMRLVQVDELKDCDYTEISDGQRQRVLLARAIAGEPDILLLDEPTSYLDIKYKMEFLSALQQMTREKQLCVILSLHELDLAERISNRLLCVGEGVVKRSGSPEEIFTKGYIGQLFHMTSGSFDEESGGLELEAPNGEPEVFVIAGGGSGKAFFHKLQRAGVPFAAGILFENDVDYPVAKALGAHIIAEAPFEKISEESVREARAWIKRCKTVVCCREHFGAWDKENGLLAEYAQKLGKLAAGKGEF